MIKLTVVTNGKLGGTRTVLLDDNRDLKQETDKLIAELGEGTMIHVKVVQGSRLYGLLAPIADRWLAFNPIARFGLYGVAGILIGAAILVARLG